MSYIYTCTKFVLENIVSIINTVEKHMWEYWRVPILHIFLCWTSQHCSHIFSSIFLRSVCVILWCSNNSWKSIPRHAVSQYISLENNVSTVLSCSHMFSADSAAVRLWQLILTFTTPHHPGCCNARNYHFYWFKLWYPRLNKHCIDEL